MKAEYMDKDNIMHNFGFKNKMCLRKKQHATHSSVR